MQKTKKQHYVPQFYLSSWSIPPQNHVFVYDKKLDMIRKNSIRDVASENYFYDIDINELFSEGEIDELKRNGIIWTEEAAQYIEKAFSENIETPFSFILKQVVDKTNNATPWHLQNCFFISEEDKFDFADFLAYQFLRTKRTRNALLETSDLIRQVLTSMGASQKTIDRNTISPKEAKYIQLRMLFDSKNISELRCLLYDLVWLLGVNQTKTLLFTTDNPVGTKAHIKNSLLPQNGLTSRGVEVFYPISPNVILIMLDGTYHTEFQALDRRYIQITDAHRIVSYNAILSDQAERFVFSSDGQFSTIEKMKKLQPDIFNYGHTQISWGGRTYYPKQ